jgi:hypothetical protein
MRLRGRGIARQGWASQPEVNRHQQTANHYRHLGAHKPPKLPDDPPTLYDSSVFVLGPLRRWLEEQMAEDDKKRAARHS